MGSPVVMATTHCDFSRVSLGNALDLMDKTYGPGRRRLLVGYDVSRGHALEIVWAVLKACDIPIERTMFLAEEAWAITDDKGNMFYSPGACWEPPK